MRVAAFLAGIVLVAPLAAAGEPFVVLLDWQHGESLVGTTTLEMSPLAPAFAFDVDGCRREILVDLLYGPSDLGADVDGVGEASVGFDFLAEVWSEDGRLARRWIREPALGIPFGTSPSAGPHEVRLSLANGANVSWDLRVRGRAVAGELLCEPRILVNEVEANPNGTDAGAEWIELLNVGDEAADLSAWTVRATHGAPAELVLPQGTTIGPGEHLVVAFGAGQALDNVDEVVQLVDGLGRTRDTTPALADAGNDARTWQRSPDGADGWAFLGGTPGASNGQAQEGG